MLSRLLMVFRIPELRNKILLTFVLLGIYRLGFTIVLPIIDQENLAQSIRAQETSKSALDRVMSTLSLFSASNISMGTIFGLGIMPYISASIIFQLLATVYPPLEKLQKEGEAGRRKINEYTRYATVLICLGQSMMYIRSISGGGTDDGLIVSEFNNVFGHIMAALIMTAGSVLLMWIGEQIDEYGIGNGISLLIMANILAQMPKALWSLLQPALTNGIQLGSETGIEKLLALAALFVAVVVGVVAITQGQRQIRMQSAKHVRGRRVLGGQSQYLPLKVNQSGVMPIVFASSLLTFPWFLFRQLSQIVPTTSWFAPLVQRLESDFGSQGYLYNVFYIALIYFFCYFWTAISFNPKDMAENLKDYGSFIPGIRPGQRTANYLEQVMVRITYVGAAFLALIAIIPTLVASSMNVDYLVASFLGGTGLLICVSVALDLVQKIDSHLVMRNYPGLLESESA